MKLLFNTFQVLRTHPHLLEKVFGGKLVIPKFCFSQFKVIEPSPFKFLPEPLNVINHGEGAALPDAYKKFYTEWKLTEPKPVHWIPEEGQWKRDPETEAVHRVYNRPIHGKISPELHMTLTGGETIIQGFQKRPKKKVHGVSHRIPHFWLPKLEKSVVYSEILNKYMRVLLTQRVLRLIHEHHGFDNYILQTRACDLSTILAVKTKRTLLLALHNKNLPYDEEKNRIIYEKYKQYLIPPEELEWYGLTYAEALRKLKEVKEAVKIQNTVPLKHIYRQQLIEYLKDPPLDDEIQEKPKTIKDKIKSTFSAITGRG